MGGGGVILNNASICAAQPLWYEPIYNIAKENAPIARFASPEEVADFFVFLSSARASYSVGSTHFVDGGMLKTV